MLNLDSYIIKILTPDEKQKIFDLIIRSKDASTNIEIISKKVSNISIILCKPTFIKQNLLFNKNIILFTSIASSGGLYYANAHNYLTFNYKQPSMKDILLKNYHGTLFNDTDYLSVNRYKFNDIEFDIISEKFNKYFNQIFILLKEICIINDITKYIYMLFIENIFSEK